MIKNSNLHKDFEDVDRQSDFYWKKKADLAFRIFDRNKDGYINKKEFRMMTTASKFPMKKIEAIFEVFICKKNVKSLIIISGSYVMKMVMESWTTKNSQKYSSDIVQGFY